MYLKYPKKNAGLLSGPKCAKHVLIWYVAEMDR